MTERCELRRLWLTVLAATVFAPALFGLAPARAAENPTTAPPENEIIESPYSGYGEFESAEEEAEDEKFFQYGRFFGVGLGGGFTSASGNAGRLYQGGFPTLDFQLIYWFDFHFAFTLGIQNSKHSYDVQPDGLTSVNLFRFIPQIRYYFDTHDLSAPLSFIGPHLLAGAGIYKRTDNIGSGTGSATTGGTIQEEQAVGFNAGMGFELTLKPKKTFLDLNALAHFVSFNDQFDTKFASSGIADRTGTWYSFSMMLLFSW